MCVCVCVCVCVCECECVCVCVCVCVCHMLLPVCLLKQEDNYGAVFLALDKLFLTIFVLEILVKWYSDFLGFWTSGWNIFDFVIVAASILGPSEWRRERESVCVCRGSVISEGVGG